MNTMKYFPWLNISKKYGVRLEEIKIDKNGFFDLDKIDKIAKNKNTRLIIEALRLVGDGDACVHTASSWGATTPSAVRCRLALGDQVLGDLGLALQPGQPWLLVHASHLLAGSQSLAHGRDELAVGGCLLLQRPGRQQVQSGAHLRPGHHRIRAGAVAAGGLAVGHISTVKRPSTLLKGPAVEPQKEQRSAIGLPLELMFARCYAVRGHLSAVCQQRSHTRPHVALRCPVL